MTTKHELSITVPKSSNFGEWYQQIITKCKLIDYYDVSGCYILLPNSYFVWESIQKYLDTELKIRNVKNVYFPLLITKKNLEKESTHIEGFSPEVAWITKTGNSVIENEENHIAVRPTSECAIYPNLRNQIQSYMDLPLKYNQWCNVVRWEFKDPTPFIRSREFLWQEGHTCHKSKDDAMKEVNDILDLYKKCYGDILAIPTIRGYKTEKEKFSGADLTSTIEGFIPGAGKAIQCATSHCLGQNFSKMFNIVYQDENSENQFVWQNSWGFTTRSIGVMIMTHGDDKGIIYPPRVAPLQIVIIPIVFKKSKDEVLTYINEVYVKLRKYFRIQVDMTNHTPGWKQNYWETMGVPIKLEIGPRDAINRTVRAVKRDTFEKLDIKVDDNLEDQINKIFQDIHQNLYNRANEQLEKSVILPKDWNQFIDATNDHKLCLVPFCNRTECEELIKEESGAKSLCIPTDVEYILEIEEGTKCIKCDVEADTHCLFGRSY